MRTLRCLQEAGDITGNGVQQAGLVPTCRKPVEPPAPKVEVNKNLKAAGLGNPLSLRACMCRFYFDRSCTDGLSYYARPNDILVKEIAAKRLSAPLVIPYFSLHKKCRPNWLLCAPPKSDEPELTPEEKLARAIRGGTKQELDEISFANWGLAYMSFATAMVAAQGGVPLGVLMNHYFTVRPFSKPLHMLFVSLSPFLPRCSGSSTE